jgi:hypothetical protein
MKKKKTKVDKENQYCNLVSISRADIERHIGHPVTNFAWSYCKKELADYLDYDAIDDDISRAINDWIKDTEDIQ